jgi:lipopolysaccharide export LptBFGC system permease protein LptF
MKDFFMIFSHKALIDYSRVRNRKYDILFFLIFVVQVFVLTSVPTGMRSSNSDEWAGFAVSSIFCFVFYPTIYCLFYKEKENNFIREVVIFSSVIRLHSFVLTGLIAIIQMFLWSLLKLERLPHSSLIYYIVYYVIFTLLVVNIVKKSKLVQ